MIGPCMCGAIDCKSCGPAQGYYPCPACGEVGGDCDHIDPDTGDLNESGKIMAERRDAAEELAWEQRIAAQREDLGPDPRDLEYWEGKM